MELKKCPEGHYYDASKYSECPTCQEQRGGVGGHTMPLGSEGKTAPVSGATMGEFARPYGSGTAAGGYGETQGFGETAPLSGGFGATGGIPAGMATAPVTGATGSYRSSDEGQTIAVVHQKLGIDPVVGWLVSVSGSEKGRDYRIHSDNNFIGRGEKMDICIRGDETISRVNHAVVAYDTRERLFYFAPGEGRSINRVNGKAVLGMIELHAYDEIEIGCTKLLFIPLCGERFEWENRENE